MNFLVINCGSSSVKYKLIKLPGGNLLAEGSAEKVGEDISLFSYKTTKFDKHQHRLIIANHEKAIQLIIDHLTDSHHGVLKKIEEVDAIGHRLVHAGEFYSESVMINDDVIDVMERCSYLAPLHNPANLKGIYALKHLLPDIPQCGVFDTAFHQSIPSKAFLYALPLDYYTKHRIRRYGFHGTSHKYVCEIASDYLKKNLNDLKIISCHLGNGASVTAVDKGRSVDTSMGFTPLEGLVMGSRCGDLDPAIIIYLQEKMGMTIAEVNNILYKKSGVLGLSSLSNDMRVIEEEIMERKNNHAIQALEVYAYRIKKYIGAYTAAMNGLDVLIFTGGVGENMPLVRAEVCRNLDFFGILLDKSGNDQLSEGLLELHKPESRVMILKIPTNEELMIAMEAKKLLMEKDKDL